MSGRSDTLGLADTRKVASVVRMSFHESSSSVRSKLVRNQLCRKEAKQRRPSSNASTAASAGRAPEWQQNQWLRASEACVAGVCIVYSEAYLSQSVRVFQVVMIHVMVVFMLSGIVAPAIRMQSL